MPDENRVIHGPSGDPYVMRVRGTTEGWIMNLSMRSLADAIVRQIHEMASRGWTEDGYAAYYGAAQFTFPGPEHFREIQRADQAHLEKLLLSLTVRAQKMRS